MNASRTGSRTAHKTLTEAEQYELMEHILHLPDAQKMTTKASADRARKERKAIGAGGAAFVPVVKMTRNVAVSRRNRGCQEPFRGWST